MDPTMPLALGPILAEQEARELLAQVTASVAAKQVDGEGVIAAG